MTLIENALSISELRVKIFLSYVIKRSRHGSPPSGCVILHPRVGLNAYFGVLRTMNGTFADDAYIITCDF